MDARWRRLTLSKCCLAWLGALSIACPGGLVAAPDQAEPEPNMPGDRALGALLTETPRLNALLIDHEIPLLGGGWGGEIFVDTPLNAEPEGAELTLRRAKGWYARRFGKHCRFKLTADYSRGGGLELSDNYVTYSGWDRTLLTAGISAPPFSLESVSDSASLTFMERALAVNALAENKSGGVTFLRRNPNSILNASLVLFNISQDDLREDGQGVVLHYVHSPIMISRARSVHVGGSFSYRWNTSANNTRFRSRPEVATINDFFIDTGEIEAADRIGRLGFEASHVAGRFSWQAEVIASRVQRTGLSALDFWGGYAFVSWFLTDDSREYDFGNGQFHKVRVNKPVLDGGWGAFELAARASYADLSDEDVTGGRETNLSLGLNWYLNRRARLMTNVVKVVDVDRPGSEYHGKHPLSVSLRLQWVLN